MQWHLKKYEVADIKHRLVNRHSARYHKNTIIYVVDKLYDVFNSQI